MSTGSTSEQADLQKHLEDLQEREARYRLKVAQDFLVLQTQLSAYRQRVDELNADLGRRNGQLHELQQQHAQLAQREQTQARDLEAFVRARAQAEDERDALQRRILELKASLSWRLSAPIRSLQRLARRTPVPPRRDARASAPVTFTYFLRTSPFRLYSEEAYTLRGWAFLPDGRSIIAMRAMIDSTIFPGRYGLAAPEALAQHGPLAQNPAPGFEVEIMPRIGRHELTLQAQVDAGDWLTILRTAIWCDRSSASR